MSIQGIRQLVTRIKARIAENRQMAAQNNREFLEFWYTHYGC